MWNRKHPLFSVSLSKGQFAFEAQQSPEEDSSAFPRGRAGGLEVVRAGAARRGREHTARSRTSQEPPRDARRAGVAVSLLPFENCGPAVRSLLWRGCVQAFAVPGRSHLRLRGAGPAGGGPGEEGLDDDSSRGAACCRPFAALLALSPASPGGGRLWLCGGGALHGPLVARGPARESWAVGGQAAPLLDLSGAGGGPRKGDLERPCGAALGRASGLGWRGGGGTGRAHLCWSWQRSAGRSAPAGFPRSGSGG